MAVPPRSRREPEDAQRAESRVAVFGDAAPSPEAVDESLDGSFPASDPPSWSAAARVGRPMRKRSE